MCRFGVTGGRLVCVWDAAGGVVGVTSSSSISAGGVAGVTTVVVAVEVAA